jgi:hypothetical protein
VIFSRLRGFWRHVTFLVQVVVIISFLVGGLPRPRHGDDRFAIDTWRIGG